MNSENAKSKKVTSWYILYLVLVILGQQLLGIGGVIGAAFIAFGLNKVIRNSNYTKNKKILYSTLYSIGGILIALIIAIGLFASIQHFSPTLLQKSNIESTYQIPAGFTAYKNENMEISSMPYPTSWTVTEGKKEDYELVFESPDKLSDLTVNLVAMDNGHVIDYKTYTASLQEQAKAEPSIKFEKMNESVKSINGKDWLVYDSIITVIASGKSYYTRTAILVTGKYDGQQYYQFLMESDKDHFSTDSASLDVILNSLRFYN